MNKKAICLVTLFLFGSWSAHAMEERLAAAENQEVEENDNAVIVDLQTSDSDAGEDNAPVIEVVVQIRANTQENRLRVLENNEQEREDRECRNGCFIAGVLVALAASNACVIS